METTLLFFYELLLKYVNIAWVSTNKSKLQALYRHQKHTARIINFKDKFNFSKPLLEQINAMTLYEMNIFQTLFFMGLRKMKIYCQFLTTFIC